jgi:hypothetical protein
MVSSMESDTTHQQTLAEAERATAALWTDYPPTPAWYYPAVGAWFAGYVVAFGAPLADHVRLPLLLVLPFLFGLFVRWYTDKRGAMPRLRSAPPEFKSAIRWYLVGYAALLGACVAVYFTAGYVAATVVAFVGATAGLWVYERAYEDAVRRTRERLG